jgi:gamma-glutamyl-gamma-aminobutyrate hydrolase PuuD
MPKVYVVGPDFAIRTMFLRQGWTIVDYVDEAVSLIQFTGGEDVDPSYYGEPKHPHTYSNPRRDAAEAAIYNEWVGKVPMAGICRGGQFLNVMNGGKMWQHVNNHAIGGTHEAFCHVSEQAVQVTSTHHQMMIAATQGKVILSANLATRKEGPDISVEGIELDTEAVWYNDTSSLCFQPHPEYVSINHECQVLYFKYLDRFLM